MKNKITREDIEKVAKEIFEKAEPRKIVGRRGCVTWGSVDINDFSHCGDNTCHSCNMANKAFKDVVTAQLENYKTKIADDGRPLHILTVDDVPEMDTEDFKKLWENFIPKPMAKFQKIDIKYGRIK